MSEDYAFTGGDIIDAVSELHRWNESIFVEFEYFFGEESPVSIISHEVPTPANQHQ
ncbi:hypothetical protein ES703_41791 [subsurface metagenome]